jgi:hypothetical protein
VPWGSLGGYLGVFGGCVRECVRGVLGARDGISAHLEVVL